MKYSLDNAHLEFFSQNRWIEFEELLDASALTVLNEALDALLCRRLKIKKEQLNRLDCGTLYAQGRDLWREDEKIKKIISQRRFAEMAADLAKTRPLRLIFDQLFQYDPLSEGVLGSSSGSRPPAGKMEMMHSFQGVQIGLILCLESSPEPLPSFFPVIPGNGAFLNPELTLNIEQLLRGHRQRYLLIGYGKAVTLFIHQPTDQHAVRLKKLGYHYGDRLRDDLHPIVAR